MTTGRMGEIEALRHELREWLKDALPAGWTEREFVPANPDILEQARFELWWHQKLYEGGWAGVAWPKEYGGRGFGAEQNRIYQEEIARAKAPQPLGYMGLLMVGPTLIAYGTEEQKARFLPKILSGEEIWCQGYSEPNSGSDLASLRTTALLDGDEFVVNGQKIWTSNAHVAHWMFLLARTDRDAPKHRGISYLLLDMKTPGLTIRPLVQITGEAHFNESFFDNVRIPRENLVGELNRGWYVGVTTLAHERAISANTVSVRQVHSAVLGLAKRTARGVGTAWDDPRIRQELAELKVRIEALESVAEVVHAVQASGGAPGAEANMCKVMRANIHQDVARLALRLTGHRGVLERGSAQALDEGHWPHSYLEERMRSIAGGTNEIQLNIIAERGLGLPR